MEAWFFCTCAYFFLAQEGEPSTMHKVARAAARFFGARPTPAEQPLYQTASELLGVDSMNLGHVAEWCAGVQLAGAEADPLGERTGSGVA